MPPLNVPDSESSRLRSSTEGALGSVAWREWVSESEVARGLLRVSTNELLVMFDQVFL